MEPTWSETRLDVDPITLVRELRKNREAFVKAVREHPVSTLGVTVSDESTPHMVVLGSTGWMTNEALASPDGRRFGDNNLTLFRSSVNWLRGSSDLGAAPVEGQARTIYSLTLPEAELPRLEYLPGLLMLLGVVALGVSVWVVRRR
jgi:hypothetical protein